MLISSSESYIGAARSPKSQQEPVNIESPVMHSKLNARALRMLSANRMNRLGHSLTAAIAGMVLLSPTDAHAFWSVSSTSTLGDADPQFFDHPILGPLIFGNPDALSLGAGWDNREHVLPTASLTYNNLPGWDLQYAEIEWSTTIFSVWRVEATQSTDMYYQISVGSDIGNFPAFTPANTYPPTGVQAGASNVSSGPASFLDLGVLFDGNGPEEFLFGGLFVDGVVENNIGAPLQNTVVQGSYDANGGDSQIYGSPTGDPPLVDIPAAMTAGGNLVFPVQVNALGYAEFTGPGRVDVRTWAVSTMTVTYYYIPEASTWGAMGVGTMALVGTFLRNRRRIAKA